MDQLVENPALNNQGMAPIVPHQPAIRHQGRHWTPQEHRLFLRGLRQYGRGNWMDIAMMVETRTPLQVSRHAHKFFRRMESAGRRQRCSINSSGEKALSYGGGSSGQRSTQFATMNNQAQPLSPFKNHADQASSSHAAWTDDLQMLSSAAAGLEIEGEENVQPGDLPQGAFVHQKL